MTKAVDRATDLLVNRTTEGLDPHLEKELALLLEQCPELDPESFELAAAAIELTATEATEPLPSALRQRVALQAEGFFAAAPASESKAEVVPFPSPSEKKPAPRRSSGWIGWLAAAAVLIAAFGLWPRAERELTPPEARSQMIAQAKDLLRIEWTTTEDPAAARASGEVVWSQTRQQGFMTFRGLPVNDPAVEQYQLWIFDAVQDEKYPVDGGVFDIDSDGEITIEIDPKLEIQKPTLFAITIEKPGGVVVSSRERLPLLAQVG